MAHSRRDLLRGFAMVAAGGLAGCNRLPLLDTSPPWEGEFDAETKAKAREVGVAAQRAVVRLHVDLGFSAKGTGFHIGNGEIVTNAHVLPDDSSNTLEVTWLTEDRQNSSERVEGTVLGQNDPDADELDIGLVDTPLDELPSLTYKEETTLSPGEPVLTVGHPIGAPGWLILLGPFHQYGTQGLTEENPWKRHEQVVSFIPTREGNSGAPLLNLEGDVVGCHWGGTVPSQLTATDPDYVHTNFSDHPGINMSVHSAVFDEHFDQWR